MPLLPAISERSWDVNAFWESILSISRNWSARPPVTRALISLYPISAVFSAFGKKMNKQWRLFVHQTLNLFHSRFIMQKSCSWKCNNQNKKHPGKIVRRDWQGTPLWFFITFHGCVYVTLPYCRFQQAAVVAAMTNPEKIAPASLDGWMTFSRDRRDVQSNWCMKFRLLCTCFEDNFLTFFRSARQRQSS